MAQLSSIFTPEAQDALGLALLGKRRPRPWRTWHRLLSAEQYRLEVVLGVVLYGAGPVTVNGRLYFPGDAIAAISLRLRAHRRCEDDLLTVDVGRSVLFFKYEPGRGWYLQVTSSREELNNG